MGEADCAVLNIQLLRQDLHGCSPGSTACHRLPLRQEVSTVLPESLDVYSSPLYSVNVP